MLKRGGILFILVAVPVVLLVLCFFKCVSPERRTKIREVCLQSMKLCGGAPKKAALRFEDNEQDAAPDPEEEKDSDNDEQEEEAKAQSLEPISGSSDGDSGNSFWQSILTKIKIIVAAWQIASSTEFVRISCPRDSTFLAQDIACVNRSSRDSNYPRSLARSRVSSVCLVSHFSTSEVLSVSSTGVRPGVEVKNSTNRKLH